MSPEYVYAGLCLVVSVCVILFNGVIVLVIPKIQTRLTPALWMVFIRSLFDLIYGIYFLIFVVPSAFLNTFAYPHSVIGFASCVMTFLTGQTIFNIALTVIDRYIAVTRPLKYTRIITPKNAAIVLAIVLIFCIIRLLLIIFPDLDFYYNSTLALCVVDFNTGLTVAASIGIPIVTFLVIVVCSALIYLELRRSNRRVLPTGSDANSLKFPLMVTLAASVFCICYIPMIVSIIWNLTVSKDDVPQTLMRLTTLSLLANSLMNVFIYTATYKPFRKALLRVMCPAYYRKQIARDTMATTETTDDLTLESC